MRDVTPENLPPFQENEAMDPSRLDSQTMSKIVERIMSLSVVDRYELSARHYSEQAD